MKNLSLAEIENYLVRHPRSNGITSQTITKIMEALYLNVKTVPAIDPEHHLPHTAYTVFTTDGDGLRFASGWTLRDAIHLFARLYGYDPARLRLIRPFLPQ